jgi:hypothetical protein
MELSLVKQPRADFFTKREEKESALQEALKQIEEFKKKSPETVFPKEFYGNSSAMYASEYIRLLEVAVLAKKSLEMMDIVLEGLMHERIKILEDLLEK